MANIVKPSSSIAASNGHKPTSQQESFEDRMQAEASRNSAHLPDLDLNDLSPPLEDEPPAEPDWYTAQQEAISQLEKTKPATTKQRSGRKQRSNGNGHIPSEVQPLQVFDFVDMLHEEYEPLQWIIPEYLPEGLALLFSRPKVGKSMLALALSLRMARRVSEGVDGEVLYLTLDDTSKRRLQSRTRSLLQGEQIELGRVWGATQSQTLDSGLVGQLAFWMEQHPTTRLIVIDVYARIKPKKQGDDVYKSDYDALCQLQEFAVKHHIAILLVHHTRKQRDTEDWIDNINGSTGLAGAVDTIWMLERKPRSNDLTLRVKGRDTMGELAVGLTLDDLDAPWQLEGEENEQQADTAKQKILAILQHTDDVCSPKQITELTGLKHNTVLSALRRMHHKNLVMQTKYGSYRIAELQNCKKDRGAILSNMASQASAEARIASSQETNKCNSAILADEKAPQASSERIAKNCKIDKISTDAILEPPGITPDTSTNYPGDVIEELRCQEKWNPPIRDCYACSSRNWLPYYNEGAWEVKCGNCNPALHSTRGRCRYFSELEETQE